jgi:WD40 repeat protein
LRVLEGHERYVTSLTALEIDGRIALASGSLDRTVRLWNPQTAKVLRVLKGHKRYVTSLAALEIDGSLALASGSDDNTIRLWDARSGKVLRVLEGHEDTVTSLAALQIDGSLVLASGSHDNIIRLWDPRTGNVLRVLDGHKGYVASLAVLEIDGSLALASGSWDNTIRLWDPRTGRMLASINAGLGGVQFASGATGSGLLAYGGLPLWIDAASLAALIANKGVVTMRRFALDPGYADSFVETKRDAATGKLMQATVGLNAWRDFLAVGYEADGRQSLRPIEDMAAAETK